MFFISKQSVKMTPKKSFIIWFTQRSGSTLLCKSLEQTKIAGKAGEFFTLMGEDSLCEKYHVTNYEELKAEIWKLGTSSNGVLGMKVPLHFSRFQKLIDEIKTLRKLEHATTIEILSDIFPNCQHIFLGRRNKVRQVVSWWRAIHDNVWHLEQGQEHLNSDAFYEEKYIFDALHHLFKESVLMECATERFFNKNKIVPLNIFYEDFVKNYEPTIYSILDFLNIEKENIKIQPPFFSITSDKKSEIWVSRFAAELQKDFKEITY